MILFGCLLAFAAAFAPRVVLILAWIFSDRWQVVWKGDWIVPLLGIIFLPYTTVMYMLSVNPLTGSITGWDWMWIFLGLLLDFWKWTAIAQNRKQVPGYPQSDSSSSQTMAQPAAKPTTQPASTAPTTPPPAPMSTPPAAPPSPPPASPSESSPPPQSDS